MDSEIIKVEDLNYLKYCGDGDIFEAVQRNLPDFIGVSAAYIEMANNDTRFITLKRPRTRAKYVAEWIKDNDVIEDKKYGIWATIAYHSLDPDRIFQLLGEYIVQCEIEPANCGLKEN